MRVTSMQSHTVTVHVNKLTIARYLIMYYRDGPKLATKLRRAIASFSGM